MHIHNYLVQIQFTSCALIVTLCTGDWWKCCQAIWREKHSDASGVHVVLVHIYNAFLWQLHLWSDSAEGDSRYWGRFR